MRIRKPFLVFIGAVAFGLSSCGGLLFGPDDGIPSLPGNRRVLFIGNSYSYLTGLPLMLEQVARLAGDTALRADYVAYANFTLEDHWYFGSARSVLRAMKWEYVLLQEAPAADLEGQAHLATWAAQLESRIRKAGAVPVMYQIWPIDAERDLADGILTAYHNAAVGLEGYLVPAGDGFTAALDDDPEIGVYAVDGVHGSARGTYLAALVILGRITGIEPESLPPTIPGAVESDSVVRKLQAAAAIALGRNPAQPTMLRVPPPI